MDGLPPNVRDVLEQARSALTSNLRCLSHSQFGRMQRRTAKTMIERINVVLESGAQCDLHAVELEWFCPECLNDDLEAEGK